MELEFDQPAGGLNIERGRREEIKERDKLLFGKIRFRDRPAQNNHPGVVAIFIGCSKISTLLNQGLG